MCLKKKGAYNFHVNVFFFLRERETERETERDFNILITIVGKISMMATHKC